MPIETKLTHRVESGQRILPVESTEGFRAHDWVLLNGERVVVRRVNSAHSLTLDRGGPQRAHHPGSRVVREE